MKNNLRQVLKEKRISFDDMAKKADVSKGTITNWCNSEDLKPAKQEKIASYLGMEVTEIFKI